MLKDQDIVQQCLRQVKVLAQLHLIAHTPMLRQLFVGSVQHKPRMSRDITFAQPIPAAGMLVNARKQLT